MGDIVKKIVAALLVLAWRGGSSNFCGKEEIIAAYKEFLEGVK